MNNLSNNDDTTLITLNNCSIIDKLRQPKFLGMAIFDWVATLGAAIILNQITFFSKYGILVIFIVLIIAGIASHILFKKPTMLNYYLGFNTQDEVLINRKNCQ